MQLHPGAYRDQIQIAAHPPAPKDRVWGVLGGCTFIFLLHKIHLKSLVLTLIITATASSCVHLLSASNKISLFTPGENEAWGGDDTSLWTPNRP